MSFEKLGLRTELLKALAQKGYARPTPIQDQAIPAILEGNDVLGGAQTGTGKTAAFALPILQQLSESRAQVKGPRALVLAPTRELAAQVCDSFQTYGKRLNLRSHVVFGGVGINPQIKALSQGIDVLIATPGRLLDLAGRRAVDFRNLQCLVLDEADRMLDMGFIHDIRKILKLLPTKRQNLLFSATYSPEIKRLSEDILNRPEMIEVARRNTAAETVAQSAYQVPKNRKRILLSQLAQDGKWEQALVFTRTKHGANRLATQLASDGIDSAAIHGNKSQAARERALSAFKNRSVRVLVATDIAARGLDIRDLPFVVNYELPNVPEDYVHRIGRTGRAGKDGQAISLVSQEENKLLWGIEKLLGRKIDFVGNEKPVNSSARHQPKNTPSGSKPKNRSASKRSSNRRSGNKNGSDNRERRNSNSKPWNPGESDRQPRSRRRRRKPAPSRNSESEGASKPPNRFRKFFSKRAPASSS